ncbi:hypothetical protein Rhe02_20880 [Rhizocola hellebori]|uniref:Uncharacterized protein n=1 Tax=Rhizocola hellebori TaxID=1392758 RepID=A0A8J3Q5B3_9ACTN|nr:hypothetical protein Rhe02_20880 [Rhizocola hellebori]
MRSNSKAPAAVRKAFAAWLVAIGAGVFETILVVVSGRAGDGAAAGVAVRAVVFAAAVVVALRMLSGSRWARLTLTIALGIGGTLSLTVSPILWLAHGNSLAHLMAQATATDMAFGASRVVHIAAVLTGCVLMFVPSANEYFRAVIARSP